MTPLSRFLRMLCTCALLVGALSACAPLFVGGTAVTAAVVASDRRTAGEQLEDQVIELKVANDVGKLFPNDTRINAMAYAGVVLLTGDVPTQADRERAEAATSQVDKVQRVVNRLRVGAVTPLGVRSNDSWLTSKVRTSLINTKDVPSSTILITTERGTVYLMGRVTRDEAERAARAASRVNGVNQVITLFDVVPRERITPPEPKTATPSSASAGGKVQTRAIQ